MISTGVPRSLRRLAVRPVRGTPTRSALRKVQAVIHPPAWLSLSQQLRLLYDAAPKGFADPVWVDAHRSPKKGPARKRHLVAASERARKELAPAALAPLTAARRVRLLGALLKKTALVQLAEVRELVAAKPVEPLSKALMGLASQPAAPKAMTAWIAAAGAVLGREPSWELATVLPALLSPTTHVCALPLLDAQARLVAPGVKIGAAPTADGYAAANRVALATLAALREAGERPADLLDVRCFVERTLCAEAVAKAAAIKPT